MIFFIFLLYVTMLLYFVHLGYGFIELLTADAAQTALKHIQHSYPTLSLSLIHI